MQVFYNIGLKFGLNRRPKIYPKQLHDHDHDDILNCNSDFNFDDECSYNNKLNISNSKCVRFFKPLVEPVKFENETDDSLNECETQAINTIRSMYDELDTINSVNLQIKKIIQIYTLINENEYILKHELMKKPLELILNHKRIIEYDLKQSINMSNYVDCNKLKQIFKKTAEIYGQSN